MTLNDRLALAVCRILLDDVRTPCRKACGSCRRYASAVAHELAAYLDERYGHSETAELIRGVVPEVGG